MTATERLANAARSLLDAYTLDIPTYLEREADLINELQDALDAYDEEQRS